MTLEEFAKKCGVVVVECGEGWGGKYGWYTKEHPGCWECGYRTHASAYKNWMQHTFGDAAKEVMKLLKEKNNGK
jgi:hypothetical protein